MGATTDMGGLGAVCSPSASSAPAPTSSPPASATGTTRPRSYVPAIEPSPTTRTPGTPTTR